MATTPRRTQRLLCNGDFKHACSDTHGTLQHALVAANRVEQAQRQHAFIAFYFQVECELFARVGRVLAPLI